MTTESNIRKAISQMEASMNSNPFATAGVKHDQDKPLAGLMLADFPLALLEVAKVTTFGAKKYAPSDWFKVENGAKRYSDALVRHLLAHQIESRDSESQLSHLAHAAWNVLAVLELALIEREKACRRCREAAA